MNSDSLSRLHIQPSSVSGRVSIPASKSQTLRAILLASMARGISHVRGFLDSPDAHAMIAACRSLGAKIAIDKDTLKITGCAGKIKISDDLIDAGNSGLVLRFISAMATLGKDSVVITGDHSICTQRPMGALLEALEDLGASAKSEKENGYAPLILQGPIQAGSCTVNGEDSQPVSALLFAAALLGGETEIRVENPGETPWIDLTLDWLDRLGVSYTHEGYDKYLVTGSAAFQAFDYSVPGDLSSCAFPVAALLVGGGEVIVDNVDLSDRQGDKELLKIFERMGAKIHVEAEKKELHILGGAALRGVDVDINDFVDALPILSVVACYAAGTTRISNAAVARDKECDRIACICKELKKMGADIEELPDGLIIRGAPLKGAEMQSHHDHRMLMSLSIAALGAEGASTVQDVDCVAKTYPSFVPDFQHLGMEMDLQELS